jgi:uncharacterized repeat protein (TIGR01451 family)
MRYKSYPLRLQKVKSQRLNVKLSSLLSQKFWYGLLSILTLLAVVVSYQPRALTQVGGAFACDRTLYISRGTPSTTLSSVVTSPNFGITDIGTVQNVEYNAVGYNVRDNFIYGMGPTTGILYRISNNGQATAIAATPPTGFPAIPANSFAFGGDIDRNGVYYVFVTNIPAGQPNLFPINLSTNTVINNPGGVRPLSLVNPTTGVSADFADIAFNPVDDQLYAFDNTQRQMAVINPTTGAVTYFGPQPQTTITGIVGASFFDAFGNFFAYSTTGAIFQTTDLANSTNPNRGVFQAIGNPGTVSRFDGASCAFAPNLQKLVEPQSVSPGGTVTYRYRLAFGGPSTLTSLVFRDILPSGATYVGGTLNNPFGGTPNQFGGSSTLEITGINLPPSRTPFELTVQVRIPATTLPGTINNQATLSPVPSNNPNDPNLRSDFPGTGISPDPTPLQIPPTPRIGLAKRVVSTENLGGGNFRVTYELIVNNAGNVDLNSLQIVERLDDPNVPNPIGSILSAVNSVTSPNNDLTPNASFTGRGNPPNTNLLAGTDTLLIGQSKTLRLVITVTPGANTGPYNNQAQATGQSPAGPAQDLSQNGTNSDPDNDGDPTNNSVPTPVSFGLRPLLGVAKEVLSLVPADGGNVTVTYRIRVRNYGDVGLTNLQLAENLATTFGTTPFQVNRVIPSAQDTPRLTANPNYNGRTDINLLAGTDPLAIGETKTLDLVVTLTPGNTRRTYENQVEGTADSPSGRVRDLSQAGINPDPDNDGNPTNNDQPTPLIVGPNLRLAKRITNVTRNGVPIGDVNFLTFVDDLTSDQDNAAGWTQLPGGVLAGQIRVQPTLQSGDIVEYTVYFLSDGGQPVTNVKFCDPIPAGTTFVAEAAGTSGPIVFNQAGTSSSRGTFFPPLTPAPSPPCPDINNPNGSVLVEAGDIPNTAPNNVGFVRFRVRIN